MKRLITRLVLFMFLTFGILLSGQSRVIAEHIRDLNESGLIFEEIKIFDKKDHSADFISNYSDVLSHITLLHLEESGLNKIISEAPEYLSLSVPFKGELIPLELYRQTCLSDSFYVIDENGNHQDYTAGEYYRGIIAGNPESIAAFSFFSNDVMGIVSAGDFGNITIEKSADKQDFLSYSDMDLLIDMEFECETEIINFPNQNMEMTVYSNDAYEPVHKHSCVKGYYELGHNIYLNNGGDITETLNWFTAVHNNVSAIYANDGVSLLVKTVKVWTEPDPYEGFQSAQEFKQQLSDFDGDFAHLINTPSSISAAFVNGLCTEYIHAVSNIDLKSANNLCKFGIGYF